uniref:Protocadherin 2 alpha a 15 n=1 Tax=Myripristis murdjan TaxID=586833 RepID=A0A667WHV7_9TELE
LSIYLSIYLSIFFFSFFSLTYAYSVILQENSEIGKIVVKISASDADDGANGEVEYSLGRNPPLSVDCRVIIKVEDVNDNKPEIDVTSLSNTVVENAKPGTVISLISLTDRDSGNNGKVVCRISENSPFELKPSFQENVYSIVTKGRLDREFLSHFNISITATDCGQPPLSTTKTLSVEIADVNDNSPVFSQNPLAYSIHEECSEGTVVGNIAKDLAIDINILKERGFRIVSGSTESPFQVNHNDGVLYVNRKIDREEICERIGTCLINLKTMLENPLEIHYVGIEVLDVNDHSPSFPETEKSLEIPESALPGARFQLQAARDADSGVNAVQQYKLSPSDHFRLEVKDRGKDGKVPVLHLQKQLDRETNSHHELLLTAIDGGKPQKSGTIKLSIDVLDINDNMPVFNKDVYSALLKENSPIGTTVIQVNASDMDEGLNGEVMYSFGSNANSKVRELFDIDKNTGEITVKGFIDFEEEESYEVDIQASDRGAVPLTTDKSVIIKIEDLNDNAPEIEVASLSSAISEDSGPGTTVALISITDSDSGLNGKVIGYLSDDMRFTLTPSIQDNMYAVLTKSKLDRENLSHYDVTIIAKDAGEPALSSMKTIGVDVSDVNDNSPEFSLSTYTFYVSENNAPGASLFSVKAFDRDEQQNAQMSFNIVRDGSKNDKAASFLNINSENGDIVALKSFDFETLKTFQFQVVATDSGTPSLSSNVTVNVFILDQNDNAPVILYPVSANGSAEGVEEIPRNVNAGHLVTKVRAYDPDIGYNGWLLFSLQEVSDHSLFGLERYTGQIRTLRLFTETDEAEHKLVILVKDNGNVSLSATATVIIDIRASDKGSAPLTADKSIFIRIVDVNDNAPEIEVTSFSNAVPENARIGTTVALVNVNDLDSGLNGKVICSLNDNFSFTLTPSMQDRMYSVVTKTSLDREYQPQYDVTISCKDSGVPAMSSENTISVLVSDVNDNSPEFSAKPYTFYVTENNAAGTPVFSVSAFDRDENENALISYHILRQGGEDNKHASHLCVPVLDQVTKRAHASLWL